jgi:cation/acetate symporter
MIGCIAVFLGIAFEKQNVAYMVSLAFGIAASSTFPLLCRFIGEASQAGAP